MNKGWRPVVNWRWRIDFFEHRDVETLVAHVGQKFPRAPIVAVGYSAGAHVLMTYLQVRARMIARAWATRCPPCLCDTRASRDGVSPTRHRRWGVRRRSSAPL